MKYFVDIDGTLCYTDGADYKNSRPREDVIAMVNRLFDKGHEITIWTARGATTKEPWRRTTKAQLKNWGVKYHTLSFDKPYFDFLIDDKAIRFDGI